jgi:glycosyltransferase involved in cell wall biosynthesis
MAMAKPVVVSRTDAIADGYGLEDGVNCRFVEPGDLEAFERTLLDMLADPGDLGARARETVKRNLTWDRYIDELWDILCRAWEREPS